MKKAISLWALFCAASLSLSLGASAPLHAAEQDECTGKVSLTPQYNFQYTASGLDDHNLTLSIEMNSDIVAILNGDASLNITSFTLNRDNGGEVFQAETGELTILATGENSWNFSYSLAATPAYEGAPSDVTPHECGEASDLPI